MGCVGNFRWGSGHHTLAGALQSDEDWRLRQVGGLSTKNNGYPVSTKKKMAAGFQRTERKHDICHNRLLVEVITDSWSDYEKVNNWRQVSLMTINHGKAFFCKKKSSKKKFLS